MYTFTVHLYLRSILTAGAAGVVFTDLVLSLSSFGFLIISLWIYHLREISLQCIT